MRPPVDPSLAFRIAAVAVPPVLGVMWWMDAVGRFGRTGFPLDDPYIHFQFARNLAHGYGLAFNPGQPVPGATSPLWAMLLAPAAWFGVPIESWAVVLGIACAATAAALTFETGRACGLSPWWAGVAAIATGATGRFVWASLSGMEPCLAATLTLAAVRIQRGGLTGWRRGTALGSVCGLAVNARPETMLLAVVCGALEVVRARRERAQATATLAAFAGSLAVLVLPYVAFCLATTGRPFPNTYYAKSVIAMARGDQDNAALRAQYLPEMLRWAMDDNRVLGLLLIPGLLVWWRRRGGDGAAAVALWPLAFWAYAMVSFPRHFSLSRYTIPLVPFLALLSAGAIEAGLGRLRGAWRTATAWIVALGVLASAAWTLPQLRLVYLAQTENILGMQVRMAEWIAATLPAGARVAANDVGAIRFYGGREVMDTVGLTSSEVIRRDLEWLHAHGSLDPDAVLAGWFVERTPDVVVVFPEWYPRLVTAPWLEPVHEVRYPNVTGGGDRLVAYRVVSAPTPLPAAPSAIDGSRSAP